MSSATARVARDLLKTIAILSNRTTRRSAVLIRETYNYTANQKKGHISVGDQKFHYLQDSQRLY